MGMTESKQEIANRDVREAFDAWKDKEDMSWFELDDKACQYIVSLYDNDKIVDGQFALFLATMSSDFPDEYEFMAIMYAKAASLSVEAHNYIYNRFGTTQELELYRKILKNVEECKQKYGRKDSPINIVCEICNKENYTFTVLN